VNDLGKRMTWAGGSGQAWGIALIPLVWFAVWLGLHMDVLGARLIHFSGRDMVFGVEFDYVMGLFWWFLLAAFILVCFEGEQRRLLSIGWLAKLCVTLGAMLVYEQHYDLDSYNYFRTAVSGEFWLYPGYDFRQDMVPSWRPLEDPGVLIGLGAGIGTENMARCMVIMASIMGPFYHALKVGFAFLGLLGSWWFYRAVVAALGKPYPQAFYLLVFFPSILFWSSIIGKDPVQFLFLGIYAYGGVLWLAHGRLAGLWYVGCGAYGVYLLRPWTGLYAVALLVLVSILGRSRVWQKGMCIAVSIVVVSQMSQEGLYTAVGLDILSEPEKFQELLESKAEGMAQGAGARGGEEVVRGDGSLAKAIVSGLFRPLPFDVTNPFTALAAIENSVILLLALVALFRFRIAYLRDPLVLWPLLMSLSWALLYGFIVMVNFGSGVRYKLQVWPFFLMVVVCLVHREGRALLDARAGRRQARWSAARRLP